jgi:prolyl 4-hydroxylase
MKQEIPADWQDWIRLNLSRGCDRDGIARILLDYGFDPAAIIATMRYVPQSGELLAAMNRRLAEPVTSMADSSVAALHAIDDVTLPFARRMSTDRAHLYLLDDFLTDAECDELVRRIRANNRASTLTREGSDKYFRTSKTSDMSLNADAFINDIDRRIADYMGFESERAEGIQGQFYEVGEQFKSHTDYFEPSSDEYTQFAGSRGQRTWTFMLYLNEVLEGGETEFSRLGMTVTPKTGMAVIWNSLNPDGSVNANTLHWGKPVVRGEKFVITKWFRTLGTLTQPFKPEAWRKTPVFTRTGFATGQVPEPLMRDIIAFYTAQRPARKSEQSDAIGTFIHAEDSSAPSHMIVLDEQLRAGISAVMQPLLESWASVPLRMTAVYGIREYQRGAVLDMHVDRVETHIVSAILNVDQEVAKDWPLHIHDHFGRRHAVILKPGELLFYESARLKHGRPEPLDGAHFANIFVHAMPG